MSQSMSTSVSSSSENTGSTPIHKLPKMGSNTFGPPGTQSQSHSNSSSTPMQQQVQQQVQQQFQAQTYSSQGSSSQVPSQMSYQPQHQPQPQPQPQSHQQPSHFYPNSSASASNATSNMYPTQSDQNIQINVHETTPNSVYYNQTHNPENQPNMIPDHQMQSIMNAVHGRETNEPFNSIGSNAQLGQLQSRDIPMSQQMLIQDEQSYPNYVPGDVTLTPEEEGSKATKRKKSVSFVEDANDKMRVKEENSKATRRQVIAFDEIMDAIHIPIILALLFVVFQMPSVNTKLYAFMPSLFLKEGKVGIGGMAVKGALFAGLYVVLNQVILFLSSL